MNRKQRREANRVAATAKKGPRTFGKDETTPAAITPEVLSLCEELDPSQEPSYVDVQPVQGALANDCYFNVEDEVKARGGSIQYGWIIWELPHIILSAEFHAVLVRDGKMIDITPKDDGEQSILFLPDSVRKFERRVVPAMRRALSPEGEQYAKIVRSVDELRLKGMRFPLVKGGHPFDPALLSGTDRHKLVALAEDSLRMYQQCVRISRQKRP